MAGRTDWREKRARRDAVSRENSRQLKAIRKDISDRTARFHDHDFAQPIGFSPAWELLSPFRYGTPISTTHHIKEPTEPD
jgi:hypothetical protein